MEEPPRTTTSRRRDRAADGDPLTDAAAWDWAAHDYRGYLVTVAKRAIATVNKHQDANSYPASAPAALAAALARGSPR